MIRDTNDTGNTNIQNVTNIETVQDGRMQHREVPNQIKSNQKAFIVSSTVIKIHSNHGNIRHNRNK